MYIGHVTFSEFAEFVIDEWTSGRTLDRHWMPQQNICSPCYVHYDFIGRFERLDQDTKHVLAKLTSKAAKLTSFAPILAKLISLGPRGRSNITFPVSNSFKSRVPLSQERTNFYANVSRDVLRKLVRLYRVDYDLFEYDYHWACPDC